MSTWVSEQDEEDFEQEQEIKKWLEQEGKAKEFAFKHISSKGTARNTLVRASFSLDQKIQEDSTGTFADLVKGSDGRDLYSGREPGFDEIMDAYLFYLGFGEDISEWLIKTLKSSETQNKSRLEKFLTDLEW